MEITVTCAHARLGLSRLQNLYRQCRRYLPLSLALNMSVFIVLAVAASILPPCYVQAQNSGDVRLVSNSTTMLPYQGRLEVFLNGEWGTICVKDTADVRAVADTACRQLRFTEALDFGFVEEMGYPVASDETPTHVRTIDCPSTDDGVCSQDYPVHILRCAINETRVQQSACSHEDDIGIYCFDDNFNTYDSQVALFDVYTNHSSVDYRNVSKSSGILGIFYFGATYRNLSVVCGVGLDQNVADTACRQLGYTNAIAFNNSLSTIATNVTIWDTGLDCSSQSHSCLNSCFSKKPTNQTSCTNIVYVSCEFQLSLKDQETPGSPLLCDTADKCKPTPTSSPPVELTVTVVVVIAIVAAVSVCAICIVCCLLPGCLLHRRRRGGYQTIQEKC